VDKIKERIKQKKDEIVDAISNINMSISHLREQTGKGEGGKEEIVFPFKISNMSPILKVLYVLNVRILSKAVSVSISLRFIL
jgi:hypothetical protein